MKFNFIDQSSLKDKVFLFLFNLFHKMKKQKNRRKKKKKQSQVDKSKKNDKNQDRIPEEDILNFDVLDINKQAQPEKETEISQGK